MQWGGGGEVHLRMNEIHSMAILLFPTPYQKEEEKKIKIYFVSVLLWDESKASLLGII